MDQARCVRVCLWLEECTMLMYNPWENICVLGSQPCVVAEPHSQLMTQIFRQQEDLECLVPTAVSEVGSGSRIVKQTATASLARLDRDGNSYIGYSNTPNQNNFGYFAFTGGHFYQTKDHVILVLSPWCSVAWLPYTVEEPIPLRAIVGGWWNGKPGYAVRATATSGLQKFQMYVVGHPVVPGGVAYDILIRV